MSESARVASLRRLADFLEAHPGAELNARIHPWDQTQALVFEATKSGAVDGTGFVIVLPVWVDGWTYVVGGSRAQ